MQYSYCITNPRVERIQQVTKKFSAVVEIRNSLRHLQRPPMNLIGNHTIPAFLYMLLRS